MRSWSLQHPFCSIVVKIDITSCCGSRHPRRHRPLGRECTTGSLFFFRQITLWFRRSMNEGHQELPNHCVKLPDDVKSLTCRFQTNLLSDAMSSKPGVGSRCEEQKRWTESQRQPRVRRWPLCLSSVAGCRLSRRHSQKTLPSSLGPDKGEQDFVLGLNRNRTSWIIITGGIEPPRPPSLHQV